jgi:hypothetical protein
MVAVVSEAWRNWGSRWSVPLVVSRESEATQGDEGDIQRLSKGS